VHGSPVRPGLDDRCLGLAEQASRFVEQHAAGLSRRQLTGSPVMKQNTRP
jgi:hypothetical protein